MNRMLRHCGLYESSRIIVIAFNDFIWIRSVIAIFFAGSEFNCQIKIIIKTDSLGAYGCK